MAKLSILAGSTSVTVPLFILDSSSTTGAGKTGLLYNTASLTAYYVLPAAAAVAITLATQTVTGAYSSGGFVEIDATNMPGWYRFDVPNAAIASGRSSGIHFKGAANMAPLPLEIELTAWNNQDGVRGGMTALPNAAAGASGGLVINGGNTGTVALGGLTTTQLAINGTNTVAQTGDVYPLADTEIAAIKAQTDKFTFTGTNVNANAKALNDTPLNGNGSTVPWGP